MLIWARVLFLLPFLTAFASASPLHWDDLAIQARYQLDGTVPLKPGLQLTPGIRLRLFNREPLDQIQVVLFQFVWERCPVSVAGQKSEIVIVEKLYGIELEPKCIVNAYVELKDYNRVSLFHPASLREL